MQISGHTELIAHIGYPTHSFKAPMIYNPYFEQAGLDVVVVPMGCEAADFAQFLPQVFRLRNLRGALITMPHKVSTVAMLDELSPAVRIAGACNAVKRDAQGRLVGDMFDGAGFVRGAKRKGLVLEGSRVLVVGSGGVGCAIAASLAAEGVAEMTLFDVAPESAQALAERLRTHYPRLKVTCGSNDPAGYDLVVNATPLGMNPDDPLPMPVARLEARTFVGEVVMKTEVTPLLAAARERGCATQVGTDMLFEMIPAYLEFFDLPTTSADNLRALSRVAY
jgi:shikimate dehydrogenase